MNRDKRKRNDDDGETDQFDVEDYRNISTRTTVFCRRCTGRRQRGGQDLQHYIPHKFNSVGCDGQVQFGNVQSARNAGRQWPDDNHFENPALRGYRILIVPESHPVVLHLISSNANDGPGYKSSRMNLRWRVIIWSLALGTPEREKVENNSQL